MECLIKWGQKATSYAIEQLDHKEVILVLDEEAGLRGYYSLLKERVVTRKSGSGVLQVLWELPPLMRSLNFRYRGLTSDLRRVILPGSKWLPA